MSRCFRYPPPGYAKNVIHDETLIESIKIEREANEKKEKKDKKGEREEKKKDIKVGREEKKKARKIENVEKKKYKKGKKKEKHKINSKVEKEEKQKINSKGEEEEKHMINSKDEKEEKHKIKEIGETRNKNHRHKKRHKEQRSKDDHRDGDHEKRTVHDAECIEKSSLTEEHGQPVCSQNSSDSTRNSNKRQKQSSSLSDCGQNLGSIIRIRLPPQRYKDPKVLPIKEQPCSSSGRKFIAFNQSKNELDHEQGKNQEGHPCSTSINAGQENNSKLSKEKQSNSPEVRHKVESIIKPCVLGSAPSIVSHCSTSKAEEVEFKQCPELGIVPPTVPKCSTSSNVGQEEGFKLSEEKNSSFKSHKLRRKSVSKSSVSKFRDLVENWVPRIQVDCIDLDDQGWLFTEQNQNHGVERCAVNNDDSIHRPLPLWPSAEYLPAADVYALPFVMPY